MPERMISRETSQQHIEKLINQCREDPAHFPTLIKNFIGAEIYWDREPREKLAAKVHAVLQEHAEESEFACASLKLLKGGELLLNGRFDQSNEYLLEGAKDFKALQHEDLVLFCKNFIGINYRSTGDIDKAIQYFEEIVQKEITIDSPTVICMEISNYQLGELYTEIKEYETAEYYYQQSLEITEKRGNHIMRVRTINGLGNLHREKDQPKRGIQLLEQALTVCQEEIGRKILEARLLNDLATAYNEEGDHQKALRQAQQSLDIAEKELGDGPFTTSLILLGETLFYTGDFEAAEEHLSQALQIAQKINAKPKISRINEALSKVYEAQGEYKKALELFKNYHELQTNFFNEKENKIFRAKNAEINQQKAVIENIHKELTDSIDYAQTLQETMLPSPARIRKYLPHSFVFYRPRDMVSGDFYWFTKLNTSKKDPDEYIIAAVDCTGHGVPGAFISIKGEALLQQIVHGRGVTKPADILTHLHEGIKESLTMEEDYQNDGMDMALCKIQIPKAKTQNTKPEIRNTEPGTVEFAGAKNPLLQVQNGKCREIKASPYAIGDRISPNVQFSTESVEVEDSSMFYIFSDGYQDQFGGPKGKKFMKKPFKRLLESISDDPPDQQKEKLARELEEWRYYQPHEPEPQVDDILVIGFRL